MYGFSFFPQPDIWYERLASWIDREYYLAVFHCFTFLTQVNVCAFYGTLKNFLFICFLNLNVLMVIIPTSHYVKKSEIF